MRGNQWDHAVAAEPKAVHPVGQPIRASTNSGFKIHGQWTATGALAEWGCSNTNLNRRQP
tara:strand:+ start:156 stop:335 length:180 start_codon:yes stop_codon:yes gene_type:complete